MHSRDLESIARLFIHSFFALQCTSTEGLQATYAAGLELPNLNYEQGLVATNLHS